MMDARLNEDVAVLISAAIADIDRALSRQMDAILRHPDFQAVESAWRGLNYLIQETRDHLLPAVHSKGRIPAAPGRPGLRIRILHARRDEWEEDFIQAARYDRTHIWAEVFASEFDTPGGEPFGLMLCDYTVADGEGIRLMKDFSEAAMASFCPVLFRAGPELFGEADFSRPAWKQRRTLSAICPKPPSSR